MCARITRTMNPAYPFSREPSSRIFSYSHTLNLKRWKESAIALGKIGDRRAVEPLKTRIKNFCFYDEEIFKFHHDRMTKALEKITTKKRAH